MDRAAINAEKDKTFGAFPLEDQGETVVELRSILAVGPDTQKQYFERAREINDMQDAMQSDPTTTDLPALRERLIDNMALMSTDPERLREYVYDEDLAGILTIQRLWQADTQGEAPAQ